MLDEKGPEPLKILKREMSVTFANTPIPDLFETFIQKKAHISMVVDEFGSTIGLVTMEDIIETLLGLEIMDESDSIEDMQLLARKNWEKRARRLGILNKSGDEDKEGGQQQDQSISN